MQLIPFCLMLFPLSAAYLRVSPDRAQFFRYDSITMTCEDQSNSTGWKVRRKTSEGGVRTCSSSWGSISSSSTCIIDSIYPTDSGVYWCESGDGKTSNSVNITVTDRPVVLESPALPVPEGAAVILRCKPETNNSALRFNFYKDGCCISSNSKGEMTIHRASKSDEGLYKCSIVGGDESVGSWLVVEDRSVVLESPILPVSEGAAVTLRCKAKTNNSTLRFNFYKDGHCISSNSTAEMTIHRASKSDEGLYKCSISGGDESVGSLLAVEAPAATSGSVSVFRLTCHLVVGTPYLLSTILLGLIYRDRKKASQTVAERRGSTDVIMEIVV